MEQIIDLYRPYRNTYDLRNYRAWVEIDFSGYKILLTWELDWGINGYHLFDNKTASSKWDLDERWTMHCYQARFYSRMNMLANDSSEIDFTYLITVKNKNKNLDFFMISSWSALFFTKVSICAHFTLSYARFQECKWIKPRSDIHFPVSRPRRAIPSPFFRTYRFFRIFTIQGSP